MSTAYVGHLDLPDHVIGTPEQRKQAQQIAAASFPYEVDIEWQTSTKPYRLVFSRTPHCPSKVHFADWRAAVEECGRGEVFIGLDARRNPYTASFLDDDPHWLFSVLSRRGKSTFLSFTIAQILHQDPLASAMGIDVKRESFKALFGVPRFSLANNPGNIGEMWDMIRKFREEMDRRCAARMADPTLDFPFAILAIDEVSQFSAMSKFLWDDMKERGDPATPPVWHDITAVAFQGAAFHCHLVLTGQRTDDRVLGGAGLIGSFGFRGLAGYGAQDWARLIGTTPIPRKQPGRGRWIYVRDGAETWVQNVLASDSEIKHYAMSGGSSTMPVAGPDPLTAGTEPSDPPVHRYKLAEAAAEPWCGLSASALRSRKARAGSDWPASEDGRWTRAEIESALGMERVA